MQTTWTLEDISIKNTFHLKACVCGYNSKVELWLSYFLNVSILLGVKGQSKN